MILTFSIVWAMYCIAAVSSAYEGNPIPYTTEVVNVGAVVVINAAYTAIPITLESAITSFIYVFMPDLYSLVKDILIKLKS